MTTITTGLPDNRDKLPSSESSTEAYIAIVCVSQTIEELLDLALLIAQGEGV